MGGTHRPCLGPWVPHRWPACQMGWSGCPAVWVPSYWASASLPMGGGHWVLYYLEQVECHTFILEHSWASQSASCSAGRFVFYRCLAYWSALPLVPGYWRSSGGTRLITLSASVLGFSGLSQCHSGGRNMVERLPGACLCYRFLGGGGPHGCLPRFCNLLPLLFSPHLDITTGWPATTC